MQFYTMLPVLGVIILSLTFSGNPAQASQVITGVFGTWGLAQNQMFVAARDNNFDVVISYDVTKTRAMGLRCLYPFALTKEIASDDVKWARFLGDVVSTVTRYKNDDTVFGWYLADEPDWNDIPPARCKELNDAVKRTGTTKPTLAVLTQPHRWYKFIPYFDLIAIDPYLPNTNTGKETDKVSTWIKKLRDDLHRLKVRKPIWVVLGAFEERPKSLAKPAFRKPTPAEFQVMLNTCLSNQVSGVLIFSLSKDETATNYGWNLPVEDPLLWETVRQTPQLSRSWQ